MLEVEGGDAYAHVKFGAPLTRFVASCFFLVSSADVSARAASHLHARALSPSSEKRGRENGEEEGIGGGAVRGGDGR